MSSLKQHNSMWRYDFSCRYNEGHIEVFSERDWKQRIIVFLSNNTVLHIRHKMYRQCRWNIPTENVKRRILRCAPLKWYTIICFFIQMSLLLFFLHTNTHLAPNQIISQSAYFYILVSKTLFMVNDDNSYSIVFGATSLFLWIIHVLTFCIKKYSKKLKEGMWAVRRNIGILYIKLAESLIVDTDGALLV